MFGLSKLPVIALTLLAACSANTDNRVETGGIIRTHAELDRAGAVLITTPHDKGMNPALTGSGETVARILDASFSRYAAIVDTTPMNYTSMDTLRPTIAEHHYAYIVIPHIKRWSGEPNQWSRYPTQIGVKLTVLDAATGEQLSSNYLESKAPERGSVSKSLNLDSEDPKDMFADLADDYIDDLYGATLFPK